MTHASSLSSPRVRLIQPTQLTWAAVVGVASVSVFTVAFLAVGYRSLPSLLPVHFNRAGAANGWQYKTYLRVLMPWLVQAALACVFAFIGVLLLFRPHRSEDDETPDIAAASTAAETVALVAFIWVAFQAYAAIALVNMWQSSRAGLGPAYNVVLGTGILLTLVVGVRARHRLARPSPRPFVAEQWLLGRLYRNPLDPALFVPTRDGSQWTLNFGRPGAAVLLATILVMGILGPTVILALLLR